MTVWQYVTEAFAVLAGNRVRSLLTILGLVIGVMAVIAIQIVGAGMSGAVGGILGGLSEHQFVVFPSQRQGNFTRAALRLGDLKRASAEIPNLAIAVPAGGQRLTIAYGKTHRRVTLGAMAEERFAPPTPVKFGRLISAEDIAQARHVAVINDDAATKLGITNDPNGASIRAGDRRYTIVGVLGKSRSGLLPAISTSDIAIPYTTYEREYIRGRPVLFARFYVEDVSRLSETESATIDWLKRLKRGRVEYQTLDRKTFSQAVDGIFTGVTLVVGLIGAVSLVVAGIGILNIMLVSVAERTREIGLRKAIGATRFQVLLQFFIEALALSAFGCAVGLVLGVLIGGVVNGMFIVQLSGVVAPIPWFNAIAIATGFATIVTVAFGTYPAWRAATLDPIEALRYE